MIVRFLAEPVLKPNPMYKSAAPMKLYREEDVVIAEQSPEFAEAKEKADKRRSSAEKAVETKTASLRVGVEQFLKSVRIDVIPDQRLRSLAVEAKQQWYDETEQWEKEAASADDETKDRWCVNFIRHNLTHYDKQLFEMKGKTGIKELYPELKIALLRRIAEAYPKYRAEIERQITAIY